MVLARKIVKQREGKIEAEKAHTPDTLARIRSMIHNPQDLTTIFGYYQKKGYTFREIKAEVAMILDYCGQELKITEIEAPKMHVVMKGN